MGNGFSGCKGYNPFCCGTSHYEINNNVFGNYGEMKIDKDKKIITNIFIPNCQLKISPEGSLDKKNKSKEENHFRIKLKQSKTEMYAKGKNFPQKNSMEIQKNLNKYFNEAIKKTSEKNIVLVSPVPSNSTNFTQINKKIVFNNYNNEFLEYLNKLRENPDTIIEDIDYIINNNVKIIDDKECIVSEITNELIKIKDNGINFDNIKEFLKDEKGVNSLKINDNLKIKYIYENIDIKKINEVILDKKREIIYEFPNCFFYPIFIKDIKINIIVLLSNNITREKLFDKFSEFNMTIFNIKNNRFFSILCFA